MATPLRHLAPLDILLRHAAKRIMGGSNEDGNQTQRVNANMAKHYSYRVDHDQGFAPCVVGGRLILCGCKPTTIELWAQSGSWVVGIGGKRTGKPDAVIYAMRVDHALSYAEYSQRWPKDCKLPRDRQPAAEARVLVSERGYYYFGDQAVQLSSRLRLIIPHTQGCKRIDADLPRLGRFLRTQGKPGVYGIPNNRPWWSVPRVNRRLNSFGPARSRDLRLTHYTHTQVAR